MITTPTDIQVPSAGAFVVPMMATQPLLASLEDLNYLWKWHRPPMIDVCPCHSGVRGGIFVYPIAPSADGLPDGLPYTFEHRIVAALTENVVITVYYTTGSLGSWTLLYTSTASCTAATLKTQTDADKVIPANAVALRLEYAPATDDCAVHQILAYPTPTDATAGIKASGHIPFDDGMLTATGAPVHTEFLNRLKTSSIAILQDRKQQCLSFLQSESGTPYITCPGAGAAAKYEKFRGLAPVRLWFPFQGPDVTIALKVLADVDAEATADLIQIRQMGIPTAEQVTFDADGAIHAESLTLHLEGDGEMRHADVVVSAKTTASHATRLRAVSGYWTPGE